MPSIHIQYSFGATLFMITCNQHITYTRTLFSGNKAKSAKLQQILVSKQSDGQTLIKEVWPNVDKDEELSRITVLQEDLSRLATTLPQEFRFRYDFLARFFFYCRCEGEKKDRRKRSGLT